MYFQKKTYYLRCWPSGLPELDVYPNRSFSIFIYLFHPKKWFTRKKYQNIYLFIQPERTDPQPQYLFYFAFYPNFAIRPLPFWGKEKLGMSTSIFAPNTTENAVILHFVRLSGVQHYAGDATAKANRFHVDIFRPDFDSNFQPDPQPE